MTSFFITVLQLTFASVCAQYGGGSFDPWLEQPAPYEQPVDLMTDVVNDLGIRILQQYNDDGNVAFSPTGVGFVLAALYEGSAGTGNQQIADALRLPWNKDITRVGLRDIHRRLRSYLSADGFLGGLTLNKDNTKLRVQYEDVLRFYGFDLSTTVPESPVTEEPEFSTVEEQPATETLTTPKSTSPDDITTVSMTTKDIELSSTEMIVASSTMIDAREPEGNSSTSMKENEAGSAEERPSSDDNGGANVDGLTTESTGSSGSSGPGDDEEKTSATTPGTTGTTEEILPTQEVPVGVSSLSTTTEKAAATEEQSSEATMNTPEEMVVAATSSGTLSSTETNKDMEISSSEATETSPEGMTVAAVNSTTESSTEKHINTEVSSSSATETTPEEMTVAAVNSTTESSTEKNINMEDSSSPATETSPEGITVAAVNSETESSTEKNINMEVPSSPATETSPEGMTVAAVNSETESSTEKNINMEVSSSSATETPPEGMTVAAVNSTTESSTEKNINMEDSSSPATETSPEEMTVAAVNSTTESSTEENINMEVSSSSATETSPEGIIMAAVNSETESSTEKNINMEVSSSSATETSLEGMTVAAVNSTTESSTEENINMEVSSSPATETSPEGMTIAAANSETESSTEKNINIEVSSSPATETFPEGMTVAAVSSTTESPTEETIDMDLPTASATESNNIPDPSTTSDSPESTSVPSPSPSQSPNDETSPTFVIQEISTESNITIITTGSSSIEQNTESTRETDDQISQATTIAEQSVTLNSKGTTETASGTANVPMNDVTVGNLEDKSTNVTTVLIPEDRTVSTLMSNLDAKVTEDPVIRTLLRTSSVLQDTTVGADLATEAGSMEAAAGTTVEERTVTRAMENPEIPMESDSSPNEVRKRSTRTPRNYYPSIPDEGIWIQNLGTWRVHSPSVGEATLRDSSELQFLVNGCDATQVPAAAYTAVLPFAFLPSLQALALEFPLDDPRYNILLLLPTDRDGTRRLARELGTVTLRQLRKELQPAWVRAMIPSFMLRGFVTLTPFLQRLGIRDVFEPRAADLSPMTSEIGVYARDVQQSIGVNIRNYMKPDRTHSRNGLFERAGPVSFVADNPFLYFIIDAQTGVSLIAGRISDPLNSRIL